MQAKKSKNKIWQDILKTIPQPWPAVWLWFCLTIFILGIMIPASNLLAIIKLTGIFLCFVYTLFFFKTDHLLQSAMCLTFVADIILNANNTAIIGIVIFLIVQLLHLARLKDKKSHQPLIIFCIIASLIVITDIIWKIIPLIYVISALYIITLLINISLSWRWLKTAPKALGALFTLLGFILFLCCDSFVGISFLSSQRFLPAFLYAPANFFAWFFYYPSQILISNGSKKS